MCRWCDGQLCRTLSGYAPLTRPTGFVVARLICLALVLFLRRLAEHAILTRLTVV